MVFDPEACAIPTVWCGDGDIPERKRGDQVYYSRIGTKTECMRKGVGVGMHKEIDKTLDTTSLRRIKYVNEKHEKRFQDNGINNSEALLDWGVIHSEEDMRNMFVEVFTTNGVLNKKAFNSVLMYMHAGHVNNLPSCEIIEAR